MLNYHLKLFTFSSWSFLTKNKRQRREEAPSFLKQLKAFSHPLMVWLSLIADSWKLLTEHTYWKSSITASYSAEEVNPSKSSKPQNDQQTLSTLIALETPLRSRERWRGTAGKSVSRAASTPPPCWAQEDTHQWPIVDESHQCDTFSIPSGNVSRNQKIT